MIFYAKIVFSKFLINLNCCAKKYFTLFSNVWIFTLKTIFSQILNDSNFRAKDFLIQKLRSSLRSLLSETFGWLRSCSHATYFPSGRISTEIRKIVLKPGVDFIQSQLSVWRFHDCLSNKWSVSVRRSDIIEPIKFPISHDFSLRVQDFWAWIESWRFDDVSSIVFANFQCDLGKSILKI